MDPCFYLLLHIHSKSNIKLRKSLILENINKK